MANEVRMTNYKGLTWKDNQVKVAIHLLDLIVTSSRSFHWRTNQVISLKPRHSHFSSNKVKSLDGQIRTGDFMTLIFALERVIRTARDHSNEAKCTCGTGWNMLSNIGPFWHSNPSPLVRSSVRYQLSSVPSTWIFNDMLLHCGAFMECVSKWFYGVAQIHLLLEKPYGPYQDLKM
jgi:hypothetical protein